MKCPKCSEKMLKTDDAWLCHNCGTSVPRKPYWPQATYYLNLWKNWKPFKKKAKT